MKKQSSPVVLISILVVLLFGAFVMNNNFKNEVKTPEQMQEEMQKMQQEQMEKMAKNQKPSDKKSNSSEALKAAIKGKGGASLEAPMAASPDEEMAEKMGGASRVVLQNQTSAPIKPQPNESATSSQWYGK